MARPLRLEHPEKLPKPDVLGEVLRTMTKLDKRQQAQGSAMMEAHDRSEARLARLEMQMGEALNILHRLAPMGNGHSHAPDPALATTHPAARVIDEEERHG